MLIFLCSKGNESVKKLHSQMTVKHMDYCFYILTTLTTNIYKTKIYIFQKVHICFQRTHDKIFLRACSSSDDYDYVLGVLDQQHILLLLQIVVVIYHQIYNWSLNELKTKHLSRSFC